MQKKVVLVIILMLVSTTTFIGAEQLQSGVVAFTDSNLEQCVKEQLSLESSNITARDLQSMTSLSCNNQMIGNLTGLEYATNLRTLNLANNNIESIEPLANLYQLQVIDLHANEISDASPLAELDMLSSLDISNNKINDISFVTNLTQLERLEANSNQIQDVSALGTLNNLQYLQLSHNQISDISVISNLTKLRQVIIVDNNIEEIPSLDKLTGLEQLNLDENQITKMPDISNTNLLTLHLSNNDISSLAGIGTSNSLEKLFLDSNQIVTLSGMENLNNLRKIDLSYNQIYNIEPLKENHKLIDLNLRNNQIKDLSAISSLPDLQILNLSQNQITDVNDLSNLSNLETLNLSQNQISDISGLNSLYGKTFINAENQVITLEEKVTTSPDSVCHIVKDLGGTSYTIEFDVNTGTTTYKGTWYNSDDTNYLFSGTIYQQITYSPEDIITGDDKVTVNEEQEYTDQELINLFNVKSSLNQEISVDQSSVDYSKPGNYHLTFSDESSNEFVTELVVNDIKPTINTKTNNVTFDVSDNKTIDYLTLYSPTATEISNGDLNAVIKIDARNVKFDQEGDYSIIFSVEDEEGNIVTQEVSLTLINLGVNDVIISTVEPAVYVSGTRVEINKQNAEGYGLPGYEYTIYDENGNVVEILVTDENGYAESEKLKSGHYYVELTGMPEKANSNSSSPMISAPQPMQSSSETTGSEIMQTPTNSTMKSSESNHKNESGLATVDVEGEIFNKKHMKKTVVISVGIISVISFIIYIIRRKKHDEF